jgi:hypothetical protein
VCKESADIEGTSRLFSLARMKALRTSLTTDDTCSTVLANMYIFTQEPTASFTQASFESVGTADMRLFNCKIMPLYRHSCKMYLILKSFVYETFTKEFYALGMFCSTVWCMFNDDLRKLAVFIIRVSHPWRQQCSCLKL